MSIEPNYLKLASGKLALQKSIISDQELKSSCFEIKLLHAQILLRVST